ncbi:hypothetical protein GGF44_001338 [Coemansia sp. RSA 1694]|nr:hypothetical protein GGF44_001338 [Coemansia sp. RSA 1694]
MNALSAVALSLFHALLYVACIYAAVALRPPPDGATHSRDHPHVIGQRMRGALVATVCSVSLTAFVMLRDQEWPRVISQLGLSPRAILGSSLVSLALTCILYVGPLAMDRLDGAFAWDRVRPALVQAAGEPACWRNYVVGPVTEELVFRAAVVPLWVAAGVSPTVTLLVSPLVFSVAHVHHAAASWWGGGARLAQVVATMLAQLAYTAAFGCYAVALFTRTGSVAGPIVAHIVCNIQGLPSISRINEYRPASAKYALWAVHIAGVLGLLLLFEPMTRPGIFVVGIF